MQEEGFTRADGGKGTTALNRPAPAAHAHMRMHMRMQVLRAVTRVHEEHLHAS